MDGIIEKQELPVTITKVKIGTKNLSKLLIQQIPLDLFVYHQTENGIWRYGVPCFYKKNFSDNSDPEPMSDDSFSLDGTLIGYITLYSLSYSSIIQHITKNDKKIELNYGGGEVSLNKNFKGKFYHILWYTEEGELKKGYIDEWTSKYIGENIEKKKIYI